MTLRQQAPQPDDNAVLTLRRGLAILDAFSSEQGGLGVNELSRRLGLHKSTVSRLCATLEHAGYLKRDERSGKLRLGARIYQLGGSIPADPDARMVARPILRRLVEACGETAHLAVREGLDVVTIEVVDGSRSLRLQSRVGQRRPVHASALGKAIMAWLSPEEMQAVLESLTFERLTANTVDSQARFVEDLARVRERGYSTDLEELEEGLRCVGAPVRDETDRVAGAISVSGPRHRFTDEAIVDLARLVMRSASQISARLGAPPTSEPDASPLRQA